MENDKTIHRIRIQRVEVEFEKPDNAFKIRDTLSEVCSRRLIPAMQQLFEEKYAHGPLLSRPRLRVDAGRLNPDNWESDFVNTVIRRLEQYLDAEGAGRRLQEGLTGKDDPAAREHERRAAFILHYIERGLLPWNSPFEHNAQLKSELLLLLNASPRQVFSNKPAAQRQSGKPARNLRRSFKRDLLQVLAANVNAMKRFLYLVPEKKILPALVKKEWDRGELRKMRKNWNAIFGLSGLPEEDRDAVFLCALHRARPVPDALSQEIVRILEQWYKPVFLKLPEVLEKYLILLPARPSVSYPVQPSNLPAPGTTWVELTEEPLYIANAGLVLLHPFLNHLFENIGHTVKYNWDSAELQLRSLVLTQYLVNGQEDYTEHELLLNKILMGFPVDAPLPLDIRLSDFEKSEARELLESVIDHWTALRNTGIGALRETFLVRPGKIARRRNGWLLEVGQAVPDILLTKIPWGFSTIKTPWMKEILNVEWT